MTWQLAAVQVLPWKAAGSVKEQQTLHTLSPAQPSPRMLLLELAQAWPGFGLLGNNQSCCWSLTEAQQSHRGRCRSEPLEEEELLTPQSTFPIHPCIPSDVFGIYFAWTK